MESKSQGESATRVVALAGAVSALLATLVAVVALPAQIADALGRTDAKRANLELQQKRAEVAAAGPRLDVGYAFVACDLVGEDGDRPRRRLPKGMATTITALPIMPNAALQGLESCAYAGSAAFLVIRNVGKREAASVSVRLQRLALARDVAIDETRHAYDGTLRRYARQTRPVTVRVPLTLAPGDGVRVPLFLSALGERTTDWSVTSRTAFLPESVTFRDGVLGTGSSRPIRRMQDPVRLASGVISRG
jgi:hypothetical protein